MALFVFAMIMFIAAIVAGVIAVTRKSSRAAAGSGAGVAAVLGVIFVLVSMFNSVPVHSVGVVTSYGHIDGDIRPGVSWLAPWKSVTIMDETIQTTQFYGDGRNGNCLTVRIGGQQLACLNITVKWQVRDSAAPQLFNDYDNRGTNVMDSVRDNLVIQQLRATANQVMGDYNPIEDASLTAASGASAPSLFSGFGPTIHARLAGAIGGQVDVLSVILTNAYYNSTTEARLASIQNQFADTAIATQAIKTDQQLAAANEQLARSLTPAIVVNNCVTVTQDILKSGATLPAGWNCFGSGGLAISSAKP
jgi:regulator of protease activity HflC (stomatin/prohibitin superfamily)